MTVQQRTDSLGTWESTNGVTWRLVEASDALAQLRATPQPEPDPDPVTARLDELEARLVEVRQVAERAEAAASRRP